MTLQPFQENAKCPKCHSHKIGSEWRRAFTGWDELLKSSPPKHEGRPLEEHLLRECSTCSYTWPEAPADAIPADAGRIEMRPG